MASKSSTATRDKASAEAVAPKRDPTAKEREAIEAAQVRQKGRTARSAVAIKREGTMVSVDTPHADLAGWSDALLDTMGTNSHDFAQIALAQVMEVTDPGADRPKAHNAALAVMGAIAPCNELEALIAGQIIATNHLALDSMGRANGDYRSGALMRKVLAVTRKTQALLRA